MKVLDQPAVKVLIPYISDIIKQSNDLMKELGGTIDESYNISELDVGSADNVEISYNEHTKYLAMFHTHPMTDCPDMKVSRCNPPSPADMVDLHIVDMPMIVICTDVLWFIEKKWPMPVENKSLVELYLLLVICITMIKDDACNMKKLCSLYNRINYKKIKSIVYRSDANEQSFITISGLKSSELRDAIDQMKKINNARYFRISYLKATECRRVF